MTNTCGDKKWNVPLLWKGILGKEWCCQRCTTVTCYCNHGLVPVAHLAEWIKPSLGLGGDHPKMDDDLAQCLEDAKRRKLKAAGDPGVSPANSSSAPSMKSQWAWHIDAWSRTQYMLSLVLRWFGEFLILGIPVARNSDDSLGKSPTSVTSTTASSGACLPEGSVRSILGNQFGEWLTITWYWEWPVNQMNICIYFAILVTWVRDGIDIMCSSLLVTYPIIDSVSQFCGPLFDDG